MSFAINDQTKIRNAKEKKYDELYTVEKLRLMDKQAYWI